MAEPGLGLAGRVGVVDDGDRAARWPSRSVDAASASIQTWSTLAAVRITPPLHHAGERAADRARPGEVLGDLGDDVGDGVGRRPLGRLDAQALDDELAGVGVDHRPLDAGAADVDAECLHVSAFLRGLMPDRARAGQRSRR